MSRSKVKEFSLVCVASFAIVIGCFIFCRGFLLNRHIFTEKSSACNVTTSAQGDEVGNLLCSVSANTTPTTPFSKAIFILLDAFRYDFIYRMPFLSSIVERGKMQVAESDYPSHYARLANTLSCAFKFVADPPTTTMQRLKALMSGTMPTFIDASANFNSYEVEEDNLIFQLNAAGKMISFLGDDTWLSLFPRSLFNSPYVEAHPSFDAWDLDTVDRAVNASIIRLLEPEHSKNWDVLIAHLLGVDHCGHRYGPTHPEMTRKLTESDNTIQYIYNNMADDTLLVVFGDHGMTKSGDHGGDSPNEVEAGVVFVTNQQNPSVSPGFQCHSKLEEPLIVSQIDFVPTVSILMGIPIPFSSIGRIFPKFLPTSSYSGALMQNVVQVYRYVTEYAQITSPDLEEAFHQVMQLYNEVVSENNSTVQAKLHWQAEQYLSSVRQLALSAWTEFDMFYIYLGIGISSLAISSFAYTVSFRFGQRFHWILIFLPSSGILSVLLNFCFPETFGLNGILIVTIAGLVLFLMLTTSLRMEQSNKELQSSRTTWVTKQCDISSVLLYILTCVAVFSNSFVINEGSVLGSVIMAAAFLHVLLQSIEWKDLHFNSFKKKTRGFLLNKKFLIWRNGLRFSWVSLLCLAVMLRAAAFFFRCREELTDCQEEFMLHKNLASLPAEWIAYKCLRFGIALLSVAIFVVTFREWMLLRECISISRRCTALIGKYIPTILIVLNGAHWALEGLPFSIPHMVVIRPALNYFPIVYQAMTVLSLITIWVQPLCSSGCSSTHQESLEAKAEKINTSKAEHGLKVTGALRRGSMATKNGLNLEYNNISYQISKSEIPKRRNSNVKESLSHRLANGCHQDLFTCSLLTNCVLVTLLLVQVTATGITPAVVMIPYVIIAILNLNVDAATSQGSWSITVLWTLASQYFFYCTGHHPVFSAIPWDSAFIGSSDGLGSAEADSWLAWIRPGLAVLGNLHVSQIIFSMALPLLVYWKGPAMPGVLLGTKERSMVYVIGGKFIILHAVKLLACMICAAHHRRHLMVWKIFAPKLIFETVSFLITSISTILSLLFVTRVDHHYQSMLAKERKQLKELLLSNP